MVAEKKITEANQESAALELKRQILHVGTGAAAAVLIANDVVDWFFLAVLLTGMVLSAISVKKSIPIISWFLKNFERKNAQVPGKGALSLIGGILLATLLFEKDVALAAIMILTLGDSISHLIGKYLGKTKSVLNKCKTIEGTIAGFAAGAIGASFFITWEQAAVASAAAMVAESFELKFKTKIIDDNLVIPMVAGIAISLVRFLIQ